MNEWAGQGDHIDFAEMPLTQLVSTAIDADDETVTFWRNEVVKFLGTDLLCYRADVPKELVDAQTAAWDRYLDWFAEAYGVRLGTTAGVTAIAQPVEAIEQVREKMECVSSLESLAIYKVTGITGSAVLALAVWQGAFGAKQSFEASRVDEKFQSQRWGVDQEALAREQILFAEFMSLDKLRELLNQV